MIFSSAAEGHEKQRRQRYWTRKRKSYLNSKITTDDSSFAQPTSDMYLTSTKFSFDKITCADCLNVLWLRTQNCVQNDVGHLSPWSKWSLPCPSSSSLSSELLSIILLISSIEFLRIECLFVPDVSTCIVTSCFDLYITAGLLSCTSANLFAMPFNFSPSAFESFLPFWTMPVDLISFSVPGVELRESLSLSSRKLALFCKQ